jgi:hypothetical protein
VTAILRIADLQGAVTRVLDASERRFGPAIDLDSLPYSHRWELDLRGIFNIEADLGPVGLGDLSEDLREILRLLGRPEDETIIWHDLSHLIGLLQLIAVLDLPPLPRRANE